MVARSKSATGPFETLEQANGTPHSIILQKARLLGRAGAQFDRHRRRGARLDRLSRGRRAPPAAEADGRCQHTARDADRPHRLAERVALRCRPDRAAATRAGDPKLRAQASSARKTRRSPLGPPPQTPRRVILGRSGSLSRTSLRRSRCSRPAGSRARPRMPDWRGSPAARPACRCAPAGHLRGRHQP